jgi:hypothetical protein
MARGGARPGAGRKAGKSANTSPLSRRARARARVEAGNQRPWPADKVERWSIGRLADDDPLYFRWGRLGDLGPCLRSYERAALEPAGGLRGLRGWADHRRSDHRLVVGDGGPIDRRVRVLWLEGTVLVPGGVDAFGRHDAAHSLGLVLTGSRTPEIIPDRGNRLPDFRRRGAGSNFDIHGGIPRRLLPEAADSMNSSSYRKASAVRDPHRQFPVARSCRFARHHILGRAQRPLALAGIP